MMLGAPGFAGEIRLPGESPEIFGMAYQYLQTRTLFPPPSAAPPLSFDKLVDFYAFGVRRNAPLLQNAGIDMYAQKIKAEKSLPDRWSIEYLWEQTGPGCHLRKMLIELIRAMWVPEGHKHEVWNELVGGMSDDPEKLIWVSEGLSRVGGDGKHEIRVSAKMQRRLQGCEWHVHDKGEYCEMSDEARLWPGGPIGYVEKYVRVVERERSPERDMKMEDVVAFYGL